MASIRRNNQRRLILWTLTIVLLQALLVCAKIAPSAPLMNLSWWLVLLPSILSIAAIIAVSIAILVYYLEQESKD
jgi:protein-S-isoprenylcysteine O-methyltransferase Ste14